TSASITSRTTSDRAKRPKTSERRLSRLFRGRVRSPAVAEAGIVLERCEIRVDIFELLANPLYERADIRPIPLHTCTGDDPLALHRIVYLAIAHVFTFPFREQHHHAEFREGKVDPPAAPFGAGAGRIER